MTAPTVSNYVIGEQRGTDLSATYSTVSTDPAKPGPPFYLGSHVLSDVGGEFIFVKAGSALKQWQCVQIDKDYTALPATISGVTQQQLHGFAQVTFTSGLYGWVALRGCNVGALTKLSSLKNVKLYVSGTSPGVLSSTSVRTSALLMGVILTSSATSTAIGGNISGPMTVLATWPRALS